MKMPVALSFCLFVFAPSLVFSESIKSGTWQAQSPSHQVHLLELYTSQGCSSCPPADRWLLALAHEYPSFDTVIPLAFHVTYWDQLGWRDAFAQPAFDSRQRALARRENIGVYTPGMFLNGGEYRQWRYRASLPKTPEVGVLSFRGRDGGVTEFQFQPVASSPEHYLLHTAFLSRKASTEVSRGENRGRRLQEGHIVRSYRQFRMGCAPGCTLQTELAAPQGSNVLVAWVTDATGRNVQATGSYL